MVNKMPKWTGPSLFCEVKGAFSKRTVDEATTCFVEGVREQAKSLRLLAPFNPMMDKDWDILSSSEKKVWADICKDLNNSEDADRDKNDLLINR
jgi:hypothetical protein